MSDEVADVVIEADPDVSAVDPAEVARIKAELRRIPISAHSRALSEAHRHRLVGQLREAAVYEAVAVELANEGYAPGNSGDMGPAVKAFYESQTTGD